MKILLTYFGLLTFILNVDAQKQGIAGEVFWVYGNQMPGPGKPPSSEVGIVREIHIYKATRLGDVEQLDGFYTKINTEFVTKTQGHTSGLFKVKLPPGEYSVFIKEEKGFFGNIFDKDGKINCIVVKPKKYSIITIMVDYEAVY